MSTSKLRHGITVQDKKPCDMTRSTGEMMKRDCRTNEVMDRAGMMLRDALGER